MTTDALQLGTKVNPYGKVVAICWDGSERYYFLKDRCGVISLMPADEIERMHADGR